MISFFYKGLKFPVLFVVILLHGWIIAAQSLKVIAKFDSSSILIGDQIKLHIEVDQPKNAKVKFPVFSDTITGKIEVIKTFPPDTLQKDGNLHIRQEYLVTSFDSGYHYVAPLTLPFEIGQVKDTIRSVSLYLQVFTMPTDTAKEIHDIKPPYQAPFTIAELRLFLFIGLGVLLIGFAIWYYIKKRRKEPLFTLKKPSEPPHIIALRELDQLRAEKLWQQNKVKQYYTRLTEIIRIYIEQRFDVKAMEQTSDEILQSLKEIFLEDYTVLDLLSKIFITADLVKFAKSQPLPDENEICLLNSYQFVNNTKQVVSLVNADNNNEKARDEVNTETSTQ